MYRCEACSVCLNSEGQLSQHRAGKGHAKKMKLLGITDPTVEQQGIPVEAFVPKYGGAFVSAQNSEVGDDQTEVVKDVLTTATTPEDYNAMLSKQFNTPAPPPGVKAIKGAGKRKFSEIYCDVCHVTINSDLQAQQHFQGTKHNKKIKLIADVSEGEATSTTDASGQKKIRSHFCHFCNISVNSEEQMAVHRTGAKHRRNVEKMQSAGSATNNSSAQPNCSIQNTMPPFDTYVSSS